MRKTILTAAALTFGGASLALADVPFFNATCPSHLEVHADEGGPVFLNGAEAKLHRFNANYYEATRDHITVSISINPDHSLAVSYTKSGGANGVCQVNAQQRHGRKVTASEAPKPAMSTSEMSRYCTGEASAKFNRRPGDLTVNLAYKIGKRYVAQGWFDESGSSTFFNCYFDESGKFLSVG